MKFSHKILLLYIITHNNKMFKMFSLIFARNFNNRCFKANIKIFRVVTGSRDRRDPANNNFPFKTG